MKFLYLVVILIGLGEGLSEIPPGVPRGQAGIVDAVRNILLKNADSAVILHRNATNRHVLFWELTKIISATVPTRTINYEIIGIAEIGRFLGTNAVVVHLHVDSIPPGLAELRNLVSVMKKLALDVHRTKVLSLMSAQETQDVEALLRYSWAMGIVDFTVLEDRSNGSRMVHLYNYYSDTYLHLPFSTTTQCFPDKLKNLHGRELTVEVGIRPGYTYSRRNLTGHLVSFESHDAELLKILMEKMNFSARIPARSKKNLTMEDVFNEIRLENSSMFITQISAMQLPWNIDISVTRSVGVESWCFVVPVLYEDGSLVSSESLSFLLLTYILLGVIWVSGKILKFHSQLFSLLSLYSLSLNISVTAKLEKMSDRMMFLCIDCFTAIWSLNFSSDLMKLMILGKQELVFDSFEKLAASNLTPVMYQLYLDEKFVDVEGPLKVLKDKTMGVDILGLWKPYLLKHRNVSCLVEKSMAVDWLRTGHNEENIRITDLCIWNSPAVYLVNKRLPLVERFSDVIAAFEEFGLGSRALNAYMYKLSLKVRNQSDLDQDHLPDHDTNLVSLLFGVTIVGSILSIIAFIAEILLNKFAI